MTADSGMPSSAAPSTIANGPALVGVPAMSLRFPYPRRAISMSPMKKTSAPTKNPTPAPPSPPLTVTASSTSS